jgi:quinol monooxygenase YgiN
MTNKVAWVLEARIADGQSAALDALQTEMSEATLADEPGTLNYEWFVDEEKSACHIYECYADSAAALTHIGNFNSKFAERFLQILEPTGLTVYGRPDDQTMAALSTMGAVFMAPLGGFAR